jgi:hypothetical protein
MLRDRQRQRFLVVVGKALLAEGARQHTGVDPPPCAGATDATIATTAAPVAAVSELVSEAVAVVVVYGWHAVVAELAARARSPCVGRKRAGPRPRVGLPLPAVAKQLELLVC